MDIVREHSEKLGFPTFLTFRVNSRENDSFYETDNVDEVLADDNASGRAIRLLAIQLHKQEEQGAVAPQSDPDLKKALATVLFHRFDHDKVSVVVQAEDRDW